MTNLRPSTACALVCLPAAQLLVYGPKKLYKCLLELSNGSLEPAPWSACLRRAGRGETVERPGGREGGGREGRR